MYRSIRVAITVMMVCVALVSDGQISFTAGGLRLTLNQRGYVSGITNLGTGKNYLYADTVSPILTLVSGQSRFGPTSLKYNAARKKMLIGYQQPGVTVEVKVDPKPGYLVLEIVKAEPADKTEAVIWGPFRTVIGKTVGEVIGVVRDGEIAIGLQGLNVKTLGGDYPNNEGSTWERGIAAKPYPWGSSIQAYSINRDRKRFVDAWGGEFKNMPLPALKGETVVGSSVALFSCTEAETLGRIEEIEIGEKLPHPTFKGVWFKKSPLFGKSYLISSFGESDVDEMIAYTKKAGLISLYHEGPFKSWGHFILNSNQFPNGREGLKKSVEKAHAAGLLFGIHTLTNFINTNDPYVTPVPDDRLSMTGSSVLVKDIDFDHKEIEVASPEYFNVEKNNNLHTVKIGKELVRYKSVTATAPYKLIDCQRGAFGTTPAAHRKGVAVGKLFDHGYRVFFPNLDMQREVAKNIADLMNETGVDHLDFDGHEGGLASGEGDYAVNLFSKDVYDQVKHEFICGTSGSRHYFWHIGSYYNWGEPWYGGFKESMQQYRIDNQALFDRNFMPHMLGWYLLAENTTLSEMEWMLARAAGYNAGFAMVARPEALRKNALTPVLLDAIREWELARTSNAFSKTQQEKLKDPKSEFHLEKINSGRWNLYTYSTSPVFVRQQFQRQPGEPTHTTWNFEQPWKDQPLQFQLNVSGKEGAVTDIKIQVDNYSEINLPVQLTAGESLVCDGTKEIRIYNQQGRPKGKITLPQPPTFMSKGGHTVVVDCSFNGELPPVIEVQFKGLDKVEVVEKSYR